MAFTPVMDSMEERTRAAPFTLDPDMSDHGAMAVSGKKKSLDVRCCSVLPLSLLL